MFHGKYRLTRAQLREVIRRAELLDNSDPDVISESDLRAISREVGISESALYRALATLQEDEYPVAIWKRPSSAAVATWFGGAGAAIGLSAVAGPIPQPFLAYTALGTLIGLTCVSAMLGFDARSSLAQRRFQLGNLGLWAGWGFTAGTMGHYEVAIPGFVIGAVAAFVGWLANRRREEPTTGSPLVPRQERAEPVARSSWRDKLATLWTVFHRKAVQHSWTGAAR
jgi:hypothetical protein